MPRPSTGSRHAADKDIDIGKVTPGARVALRNDSYTLHVLLPTKVDPLVSLMKVGGVGWGGVGRCGWVGCVCVCV